MVIPQSSKTVLPSGWTRNYEGNAQITVVSTSRDGTRVGLMIGYYWYCILHIAALMRDLEFSDFKHQG
ncbi:hypothetical protein M5689_005795 [Euphorbia peplus]|nr:hypothetical protein M5689_005795 [Euphorbia peplus]